MLPLVDTSLCLFKACEAPLDCDKDLGGIALSM
jgi:hypothetical protein